VLIAIILAIQLRHGLFSWVRTLVVNYHHWAVCTGVAPFFSRLNEPTRSQTVASWLLILHATFFFNKLIFFVVCELYIYFVGHLDLGEGINQVFLRSLCVRMRVLCVRVLIFITIHISRPVQKRRFWHWIKKKK